MNDLQKNAIDQAMAAGASKSTYAGATTSVAGWLLSSEFIAVGGFFLAVVGFLVNLYFKLKDDRRQQAVHDAQMREIENRQTMLREQVIKEVDTRLSRRKGRQK